MYAVVKWIYENKVGVVPENWLRVVSGKYGAVYPPSRVLKRVLSQEEPSTSWDHYEAKLYVKDIETYDKAYALCGQYCTSSDYEQESPLSPLSTAKSIPPRQKPLPSASRENEMADATDSTASNSSATSRSLFSGLTATTMRYQEPVSGGLPPFGASNNQPKRANDSSNAFPATANTNSKEPVSGVLPQFGASNNHLKRGNDSSNTYPSVSSMSSQEAVSGVLHQFGASNTQPQRGNDSFNTYPAAARMNSQEPVSGVLHQFGASNTQPQRGNDSFNTYPAAASMNNQEPVSGVLHQFGASNTLPQRGNDSFNTYPAAASMNSQGSMYGVTSGSPYTDFAGSSGDLNSSYLSMLNQKNQSTPKQSPTKRVIEAMYRKVSLMDDKLSALNELLSKHFVEIDESESNFRTLQTVIELDDFEDKLGHVDFMQKMVKVLTPYCKRSCGKSITIIMDVLAVRAVWMDFSLRGQRKKKAFDKLQTFKLVKKTVHRSRGFAYSEIEEHITLYFKRLPIQQKQKAVTARSVGASSNAGASTSSTEHNQRAGQIHSNNHN